MQQQPTVMQHSVDKHKKITNTPSLEDINILYKRKFTKKTREIMFETACALPDPEKRLTIHQFKALRSVWGVPKGYTEEDF